MLSLSPIKNNKNLSTYAGSPTSKSMLTSLLCSATASPHCPARASPCSLHSGPPSTAASPFMPPEHPRSVEGGKDKSNVDFYRCCRPAGHRRQDTHRRAWRPTSNWPNRRPPGTVVLAFPSLKLRVFPSKPDAWPKNKTKTS